SWHMPRKSTVPGYNHHKPSNRGYTRFGGRNAPFTYFPGPYGSEQSRTAYAKALAEWETTGRVEAPAPRDTATATVAMLVEQFRCWMDDEGLYHKGGEPTSERHCLRAAFYPLIALFADLPADQFGLTQLEALADAYAKGAPTRGDRRGWAPMAQG